MRISPGIDYYPVKLSIRLLDIFAKFSLAVTLSGHDLYACLFCAFFYKLFKRFKISIAVKLLFSYTEHIEVYAV